MSHVCEEETSTAWFEELMTVDAECSLCDAHLKEISELQQILESSYKRTIESVRGNYDPAFLREKWYGMAIMAQELRRIAGEKQSEHPICGADMVPFEKYHLAALERFALVCPKGSPILAQIGLP